MRSIAVLFIFAVTLPVLSAQTITGTIQGVVSDPSGALIPSVSITIRNVDTNQIRETITNEIGRYTVPLLPPGRYEVRAELTGFKSKARTGLELQLEQRINADFMLELGDVSERLVITDAAPLVQADTATVGNVLDSQKRVELPLNGRLFSQIAILVPGATTLPAGTTLARPERDSFSVAGLRNTANNYLLDGIDNNDVTISIALPPNRTTRLVVVTPILTCGRSGRRLRSLIVAGRRVRRRGVLSRIRRPRPREGVPQRVALRVAGHVGRTTVQAPVQRPSRRADTRRDGQP